MNIIHCVTESIGDVTNANLCCRNFQRQIQACSVCSAEQETTKKGPPQSTGPCPTCRTAAQRFLASEVLLGYDMLRH